MWTSVGGRRGRPLTGNQGSAQQNTIVDFGVGPTLRWCPLSVFNDGAARCYPGLSSSVLLCGRQVNDNANRHNVSFIAWPAALRTAGAGRPITVAATHRLLLPGAHDKLGAAGIDPLYLTDSVPVADRTWPDVLIVSLAPLLAQAIARLSADGALIGIPVRRV